MKIVMKREYIKPVTEKVNVKLFGSVLDGETNINVGAGSNGTDFGDAKESNILWGDDSTSGDLWDDEENAEEY